MPTLNIEGRRVKVDDGFMSMSPEEQNATVDEIAGQLGVQAVQGTPETAEQEGSGIALNTTAGINEGIYGTLGAPVDLSRWIINKGIEGANYVTGSEMPTIPSDSFGGSESISNMFGAVGVPEPEDIVAGTTAERIARGTGQGIGYSIAPEAAIGGLSKVGALSPKIAETAGKIFGRGASVGETTGNMVVGATSGAGATGAMEATPDEYDALSGVAGGLAAGVGGAVLAGVPAMLRSAKDVAVDAASPLYTSGRERLAAKQIADEATDIGAVKSAISEPVEDLVPGSKPTTFQVTGDMGLGGMERGAQVKRPDLFQTRRSEQNAARVSAMEGVQTEGAPETVATAARRFVKSVEDQAQAAYDDVVKTSTASADDTTAKAAARAESIATAAREELDTAIELARANADTMTDDAFAEAERNIAALRQRAIDAETNARSLIDRMGTGETPRASGDAMRGSLEDARAAAKAAERTLWSAVDPDGTLALPAQNTRQRAAEVISELPASAKPPSGEEAAILDVARSYDEVIPFNELTALQSRIKAELRAEKMANGESPAYRRLSMLNAATEADIEAAVAGKMQQEAQAVARGEMAEADTLASILGREAQSWYEKRNATARLGQDTATGTGADASVGQGRVSSASGAEVSRNRGLRGSSRDTGVQKTGLEPNFDPSASERLKTARTATRERVETFDNKTLGPVRRRPTSTSPYDMPSEVVPRKIFFPRPESAAAIDRYRAAVGRETADQQISQYAIDRLRQTALKPDGTIDARSLATFRRGHAEALRAIPELDARLADTESAAAAMAETGKALETGAKAITKEADSIAKSAEAGFGRAAKEAETLASRRIKEAEAESASAAKQASAEAGRKIAEAAKAQKAKVDEAQRGRLGQLMKLEDPQDVTRNVSSIFSRQDAIKEMRKVRSVVSGDAEAEQGLRKAIVDHITGKFVGNTEAGTSGDSLIKSDQFQTFMRNHARTLEAAGFTKDEIRSMQAIADDLRRANRSITAVKNPGGSNTAQDAFQAQKGDRASTILARVLMGAGAVGGYTQSGGIGALAGAVGGKLVSAMRAAGIETVDDIVADALLNPERARVLLSKIPSKPDEGAFAALARYYRKSVPTTAAVTADDQTGVKEMPTVSVGKTARGLPADGSATRPVNVESAKDLKAAADRVNTDPTDGQKKAGNYAKLHARVSGFDVAIENPAGSIRKGKARNGKEWEVKMPVAYGYLKGSKGADGDPIDVFVGKNLDSDRIYVIDQIVPGSNRFDEHKVIMGASSPDEARDIYIKSFSDGRGARRLGAMQPMSREKFQKWIGKSEHTEPVRWRGQKFGNADKVPLEITVPVPIK